MYLLCVFVGTDVNATDVKGVTPLHLALSRLRLLGDKQGRIGEREGVLGERVLEGEKERSELENKLPTSRKKEIMQVNYHLPSMSILPSIYKPVVSTLSSSRI